MSDKASLQQAKSYTRGVAADTTGNYMGSLMSFLAKHDETDGRVAVMMYQAKVGNEPPPHVHQWEHELYYILEGEMEFFCEDQTDSLLTRAGDLAFLPRGRAHAFYIRSPEVKTLIMLQAAGEHAVDSDTYFTKMSQPVTNMEIPQGATTYATDEDIENAVKLAAIYGMRTLSPEEIAKLLPFYPGFLANIKS